MEWRFVVLPTAAWSRWLQGTLGSRSWLPLFTMEVLIFDSRFGSRLVLIGSKLVGRNEVVEILLLLLILTQHRP